MNIIELIPEGVVVTSLSGSIEYANANAAECLGYGNENLLKQSIYDIFLGTEDGQEWQDVVSIIQKGELFVGKGHFICVDHTERLCSLHCFVIYSNGTDSQSPRAKAKRPEIVIIFRDITKQQRIAAELERKNLEMAKMNSELIRSNLELKRVSELKSNFLSIASHELKTPLTSIKGYSEIIIENMQDKLDGGVFKMIESISRAADRLHKVINNMLDVTRIEQKRLRLHPEQMDLAQTAQDCIEDLLQFSAQRQITFNPIIQEGLPPFYGDKMRIQQVFTNLFSNALKYSPDNSTVDVIIEKENDKFHITVRDYGIGIDPGEQDKIFDAFYEIGKATRHSTDFSKFLGGGTGLGLSIVKGIIERHGGRIWAESKGTKEGEYPGSEFHIVLPVEARIPWDDDDTKVITIATAQSNREEDIEGKEEAAVNQKPLILLIDDDREAIEIARMVLENAFDIIVAESGEHGLTLAFERKPSMILLDLYLPGLDGSRICRILRSQEETRDIPVAFFSAGTQNDEMQRCFASGADDFIVKPFSGRELVEKIWRILMKKKEEGSFL
ncbi:MAG: ATP-binding protein [Fibrobacterota bacterium]